MTVRGITTDGVLDLLAERVDLYEQLLTLARAQAAAIDHPEADKVIEVLTRREPVVESLARCVAALEAAQPSWDAAKDELDADTHADATALSARADELAESLAALDAEHQALLNKQRDDLAGEIARLRHSGKAVAAYGGTASRGPSFRDEEG